MPSSSVSVSVDVLICGAGASGLALGIELARRGVSVRHIEKSPVPFHGSRGKGIQPRTLEIFEDMGVVNRMMATGAPYPVQRKHAADGTWLDTVMVEATEPTAAEPYGAPLMLPQFLTEGILRDRLAELGGTVAFGCELVGFQQDADGVTATVRRDGTDERVRATWLVAADGGRSFVRHALGIGFEGKDLGVRAVVADVSLHGLSRDAWHRFDNGDVSRQVAICPLAGTNLFQVQAPVPLEGDIDLSAEGITALVRERCGRGDITVASVSWASAYKMSARLADQYRVGRVFLVGDAAHIHPPTGGQGLNTSVQDAYNLGWKLAAVVAGAPVALLDTYEEERRPVAAGMLGLATRMLYAMKQGSLRRTREVNQLDIGYEGSSLALEAPARGADASLRAGNRAPDARLLGAGGQPVRLFDLLRGTHWTLLGFHVAPGEMAPRPNVHVHVVDRDLRDPDGDLGTGYDVKPGTWLLIRPDGYVGAITDQVESMRAYLDNALVWS